MTELEQFTTACIEALYFTDTGEDEQPNTDAKLDEEALRDLIKECRLFWNRFNNYIEAAECRRNSDLFTKAEMAGHDFWLTRNGHGAGFWNGDWNEPFASILTDGCKFYGKFETYAGDDGLIYHY